MKEVQLIPEYTVVVGVDLNHLDQFTFVVYHWYFKRQQSLFNKPWVIFYHGINPVTIHKIMPSSVDYRLVYWPGDIGDDQYPDDPNLGRFGLSQRYRMLSGFVHVPAQHVKTPYWLKLDLDVLPKPNSEDWIDPNWFDNSPAIIAHRWGYTKPANQMMVLDKWVEDNKVIPLIEHPALNMQPSPGASSLPHARIISWCGFFNTEFTYWAATAANSYCGNGKLPVPSQDGYLWYCAERQKLRILRVNMKNSWEHCSTLAAMKRYIDEHP